MTIQVKITIIFSAIHLHYDFLVNPASTFTYYRTFVLVHQSKFSETKVILIV